MRFLLGRFAEIPSALTVGPLTVGSLTVGSLSSLAVRQGAVRPAVRKGVVLSTEGAAAARTARARGSPIARAARLVRARVPRATDHNGIPEKAGGALGRRWRGRRRWRWRTRRGRRGQARRQRRRPGRARRRRRVRGRRVQELRAISERAALGATRRARMTPIVRLKRRAKGGAPARVVGIAARRLRWEEATQAAERAATVKRALVMRLALAPLASTALAHGTAATVRLERARG